MIGKHLPMLLRKANLLHCALSSKVDADDDNPEQSTDNLKRMKPNNLIASLACNPLDQWTPWEAFADKPEQMIDEMVGALRGGVIPAGIRATVINAVMEFCSPNKSEERRTRAKIAWYLVTSYRA